MKYATLFFAGSLALGVLAFSSDVRPLLLWLSSNLAIVATGYAGLGPRVFGKREDGTLGPLTMFVLAPYLLLTWTVWHASRLLRREVPFNRLVGDVTIGRRLLPRELPSGIDAVVDLTAEFREPHGVRTGRTYQSFPILDGSAPQPAALEHMAREVSALPGEVYVHCAEGHGRTALVAAAILLVRGKAATSDEAVQLVLESRAKAHMNRQQRQALDALANGLAGA